MPWALSAAVHVVVIAALFWPRAASPPSVEPEAIPVTVVPSPAPEPPGPPGPPGPPAPPQAAVAPVAPPVAKPVMHAASPRLAQNAPLPPVDAAPVDDYADVLTGSQLAGAISADTEGGGGGAGGGGCDTAQIVQRALRRDPLVRTAVEGAHRLGKSVMLWNGDWVRSGTQDGKGLSAVREAIVWELAFTPTACRDKRVHGVVLLSLADGNTRFAIGAGDWRWSDLLQIR